MLFLFVPMIYVVVLSKYAKCVIISQVHQTSNSLPTLKNFKKIFSARHPIFTRLILSYTLCSLNPHWCDLSSYNCATQSHCPRGLWFGIIPKSSSQGKSLGFSNRAFISNGIPTQNMAWVLSLENYSRNISLNNLQLWMEFGGKLWYDTTTLPSKVHGKSQHEISS